MTVVETASLVQAGSSVLSLGAIIVLVVQIVVEHTRSKRVAAITLMQSWSEKLGPGTSSARALVEHLTDEQLDDLWEKRPVALPSEAEDHVAACLGPQETGSVERSGGKLKLNQSQVASIRWALVSYVNALETVMVAREHRVVDKKMVEGEFAYLTRGEYRRGLQRLVEVASKTGTLPGLQGFLREEGVPDLR
jgi:hypothetical protein